MGLLVTNKRLRVKDFQLNPLVLGPGWFVEEVAGIPVSNLEYFRAALNTVDRAGGEEYEILFSEGVTNGITTARNYRDLCNESPFESGRRRRPEHVDTRVSASMYLEIKSGTPEGGAVGIKTDGYVSLL